MLCLWVWSSGLQKMAYHVNGSEIPTYFTSLCPFRWTLTDLETWTLICLKSLFFMLLSWGNFYFVSWLSVLVNFGGCSLKVRGLALSLVVTDNVIPSKRFIVLRSWLTPQLHSRLETFLFTPSQCLLTWTFLWRDSFLTRVSSSNFLSHWLELRPRKYL